MQLQNTAEYYPGPLPFPLEQGDGLGRPNLCTQRPKKNVLRSERPYQMACLGTWIERPIRWPVSESLNGKLRYYIGPKYKQ